MESDNKKSETPASEQPPASQEQEPNQGEQLGGTTPQEPVAEEIKSTENGPAESAGEQFASSREQGTNQTAQFSTQQSTPTQARRNGGPRTRLGKAGSRRNALKHGLSAKVLLLDGESPAEFDALLRGFRDSLQPVGMPEEITVKDMAWSMWCSQRGRAAERAEIQLGKKYNSHAADRRKRDREEAEIIEASVDAQAAEDTQTARYIKSLVEIPRPGLIARFDNPVIAEKCVSLLKSIHDSVKLRSFFPDRDDQIIDKIFGARTPSGFRLFYASCVDPKILLPHLENEELEPLANRVEMFLTFLEEQIDYYEQLAKRMVRNSTQRERLEAECAVVPEAPRLDRILRYRASHERDFDRSLLRLERLQRIRKGQPVPPTLNVNLST